MRARTDLEEAFWISYAVEQATPSRHLSLPRAANDDLETGIEVIQKLHDAGQQRLIGDKAENLRATCGLCVGVILIVCF